MMMMVVFHCARPLLSPSEGSWREHLEGKAQKETERGVAAPVCSEGKKLQLAAVGENYRLSAPVRPRPPAQRFWGLLQLQGRLARVCHERIAFFSYFCCMTTSLNPSFAAVGKTWHRTSHKGSRNGRKQAVALAFFHIISPFDRCVCV
jgi:hypothetical protein